MEFILSETNVFRMTTLLFCCHDINPSRFRFMKLNYNNYDSTHLFKFFIVRQHNFYNLDLVFNTNQSLVTKTLTNSLVPKAQQPTLVPKALFGDA